MPSRLLQNWDIHPRLLEKIIRAKGPVAFLDESFQSPAQGGASFYIHCAVVVSKSNLFALRSGLRELAQSKRWHTTEAGRSDLGRQRIRAMAHLVASVAQVVLVLDEQLDKSDTTAEQGRVVTTKLLLDQLAQNQLYLNGTVIYEKRIPGEMRTRDEAVLKNFRLGNSAGAELFVWGIATKNEPLLWAPDLVAWCYRQAYFEKDASFYQDLARVTSVIRC